MVVRVKPLDFIGVVRVVRVLSYKNKNKVQKKRARACARMCNRWDFTLTTLTTLTGY
ncbi:MAG: hypothetical protein JRC60_00460 [Deltaproteobacteria bacterium]|nr:hypothetical protein [Deltaproteobacteria bacterium]